MFSSSFQLNGLSERRPSRRRKKKNCSTMRPAICCSMCMASHVHRTTQACHNVPMHGLFPPSSLYLAATDSMAGKTFSQVVHQVAKKKTTERDPSSGATSGGPETETTPLAPTADGTRTFCFASSPPAPPLALLLLPPPPLDVPALLALSAAISP